MLNDSQKDRLLDLFAEGAELPTAARAMFVRRSCDDDPVVRDELADLLKIDPTRLEGFMTQPVAAVPGGIAAQLPAEHAAGDVPRSHQPPSIDGYTDFEQLAEGGMGTVYRARQLHPVSRTVAIKVIRVGMDSDTMLQRFEAERQALALMSHPYIAAVHDAGTDSMGRPFLAMEFADGEAITDFCDREQLPLTERLQLFIKVCQAVDHAHRRGVLHRDLKPSNVLVSRSSDQLLPKVIDFGIAKALEGSLGEHSLHTQQGSFLGTPEYMSPEQLDGAVYSIDTRSDVYSLGVMLYELVTHSRPIDPDRLRQGGLMQLTRIIREEVPPKPSTRMRERLANEPPGAPQSGDRTRWLRRLQGDLDWIVMKALEKEPEHRYGSSRELAADLERYLTHMPVAAGPPSGLYRLRKFTRRYRVQVIAAVLVLLSMVVGLFGTTWFLFESRANEEAADQRARDAEGSRIAAQAAVVAASDPNLAMLLALEARRLTDSHTVNQTVLDLLPNHDLVGRFDHYDQDVYQALFLPDGRLLSHGFDPVALLTDPDRGVVLRRFVGHEEVLTNLALAPTANLLLTTCEDGTARVWDIDSGACLHAFDDHTGSALHGAFSADSRLLATGGEDHAVRVYDVGTGRLLHVLGDHSDAVTSVCFDPSGRRLACQSRDRTTRIWNTATGEIELLIPATRVVPDLDVGGTVRFAPSGDRIVRSLANPICLYSVEVYTDAGELVGEVDQAALLDVPVSDPLMVRIRGGFASISLQTGQVITKKVLPNAVGVLAPSPDGRFGVGLDSLSDLVIFDLELGRVVRKLSGRSDKQVGGVRVALHPDGLRFAVLGSLLRMWTWLPEFAPLQLQNEDGRCRAVSLGVGAEALALVKRAEGPAPGWSLWSIDQRRLVRDLQPEGVQSLRLSADATRLIGTTELPATGGDGPRLRTAVFDLQGQKLHGMTTALGDQHVLGPDGRMQIVISHGGAPNMTVRVFDLASGVQRLARTTPRGADRGQIRHLDLFSGPEFAYYSEYWGPGDRTDVIDIDTGETVFRADGPAGSHHYGAAVDAQGQYLLVVLGDLRARVYDLHRPGSAAIAEYAQIVRSDTYQCGFVAGRDLAWVACHNEVHLFACTTGVRFAVLRLDARVQFVAGNDDGTELHTISYDGVWQRWPLDPVGTAKRLALGTLSRRALDLYGIGTDAEREARELQNLRDKATPRSWVRMGERALQRGDLDEAIACYQRCIDLGPRARHDQYQYLRLLELRCRRLTAGESAEDQRVADRSGALAALQQALRCGAKADQLRELPCIDAVRNFPEFRSLLPD